MSIYSFKVNKTPLEALEYLKRGMDEELVYEKVHDVAGNMRSIIVIYEKYFMRNSSRASLVVAINNFNKVTEIETISSGSSQGMIFNFDWGAGDEFAHSVKHLFEDSIID
ncbi:DUF6054 family protein [Petrocella sp. FN5]|uniref:DUF6054 family protein n=1 Tax=Petrocella sp. FN5 TaxID=3032002 RepID=UPI0023DAB315|nr:DUF6054 family protein [Petrocella sp. FN5]MDF1617688.1 DUF6054 family protein [Petrocella sp. FN5]